MLSFPGKITACLIFTCNYHAHLHVGQDIFSFAVHESNGSTLTDKYLVVLYLYGYTLIPHGARMHQINQRWSICYEEARSAISSYTHLSTSTHACISSKSSQVMSPL
jgi:hypothetical protein